jgi:hypothetical protein
MKCGFQACSFEDGIVLGVFFSKGIASNPVVFQEFLDFHYGL